MEEPKKNVADGSGQDLNPCPAAEERADSENAASEQQAEGKDPTVNQDKTAGPSASENPDSLKAIQAGIEHLEQNVNAIADSSRKTAVEIREMHKLYHNEFASRLKSMQDELDQYREIEKGRVFDGILGEVAKLYADYEPVLDGIEDPKAEKRIRYMFLDILQILEANGVSKQKSKPGEKRNTKYCQVVDRVPTDNTELHDTVVKSRGTGFYIDNRPLIKELVDVRLFNEKKADEPAKY
jgi:molecular chaperone GrpE (heat shock protein)